MMGCNEVPKSDRLLLILPIKAYRAEGRIYVDEQACNGLRLWLENFRNVIFACVVLRGSPPVDRSPIDKVPGFRRLRFVGLPEAYTPYRFITEFSRTSRLLSELINEADYLHFAIGGLWGDWASLGCMLAFKKNRPFAVWTDRVESKVASFHANSKSGIKQIYWRLNSFLMKVYERQVIKRSSLGLFHGMDCYEAYARHSSSPHLVHDIHLNTRDKLTADELVQRYASAGEKVRLVYAGRAHREKGVFDWVEALKIARSAGVKFDAVWFGDGPDREAAISAAALAGIESQVHFPGTISDHYELISRLKQFDAFLFSHKTPESPRCLIEALICGLPIIGYDSAYARDLICANGGGILTSIHKPELLANSITTFQEKRKDLTDSARRDGSRFDAEEVFRHRSQLMRTLTTAHRDFSPRS